MPVLCSVTVWIIHDKQLWTTFTIISMNGKTERVKVGKLYIYQIIFLNYLNNYQILLLAIFFVKTKTKLIMPPTPTGDDVHVYDIATKTVKTKTWPNLPTCTSALRWLEHYYCFHGNSFTRFNPVSGEVSGSYPKDTRRYFMSCADFGKLIEKVNKVSFKF